MRNHTKRCLVGPKHPLPALEILRQFPYVRLITRKGTDPLDTNKARLTKDGIRIYDTDDFAGMAKAGALAAQILDDIAQHVVPGQSTAELDRMITDPYPFLPFFGPQMLFYLDFF